MNEKQSAYLTVTDLEESDYAILVGGGQNKKISKSDLLLILGSEAWFDGGQKTIAQFQAGATIDGNPNIKQIAFETLPPGSNVSQMILINDENLAGPALSEENIELFNDAGDFLAGNLLDNWMGGSEIPSLKANQLSFNEKSGKIFTTGIVLKLRLTSDIAIADLTAGKFRIFYKLEKLPIDFSS